MRLASEELGDGQTFGFFLTLAADARDGLISIGNPRDIAADLGYSLRGTVAMLQPHKDGAGILALDRWGRVLLQLRDADLPPQFLIGDPHFDVFHIASNVLIFGGFLMLSYSWHVLWKAQRRHKLATTGIYARMRHPQYAAFISIMLGFLLQWPTLPTLVMFPILTFMYLRLALKEEKDIEAEFGDEYRHWAAVTPRFIPRLSLIGTRTETHRSTGVSAPVTSTPSPCRIMSVPEPYFRLPIANRCWAVRRNSWPSETAIVLST
jgi:protein-S-isoprenylcysteine O-methyltransferase Ste14